MEAFKILVIEQDDFDRDHGFYLDLPQDFGLSLTTKNILFAFDDAEVSRSVSFNLPATPNNNKIMYCANDPARGGGQARITLDCQLQYSAGVANGRLHVTGCDKSSYKCILTFGELLPLKRLREAGKLADVLARSTAYPYKFTWEKTGDSDGDVTPLANQPNISCSLYNRNYSAVGRVRVPSYNMGYLLYLATQQISGVSSPAPIEGYANAWLLPTFKDPNTSPLVFPHRGSVVGYPALSYNVKLADQMPDWDVIDLLRNYANYAGLLPYIQGTKIMFDDGTLTGWVTRDLKDVISVESLKREFGDWAQKNILLFKESYKGGSDGKVSYNINNRNIDVEKTLHEFEASRGGVIVDGVQFIDDGELVYYSGTTTPLSDPYGDNIVKIVYDGTIICQKNSSTNYLEQQPITKNPLIEQLCSKSTCIKVKAKMVLRDYISLPVRLLWNLHGKRYVWTDAKWSNGIVEMMLSKYD